MSQSYTTDTALVQQLQANDAGAFEALFRLYWKPLYLAAYKRLHNRQEAEDIVQEVLIGVWQRRAGLNTDHSLSGYLFTALKYRIISFYAKIKTERFQGEILEQLLNMQAEDQYAQLLSDELKGLLLQEIQKMPANMQRVYQLTRNQHYSIKEVAQKLGLSEQTVKNLTTSSSKRLRRIVEQYYADQPPQATTLIVMIALVTIP
jgi:RNA polymerase sigma-70 factor (family 1)